MPKLPHETCVVPMRMTLTYTTPDTALKPVVEVVP